MKSIKVFHFIFFYLITLHVYGQEDIEVFFAAQGDAVSCKLLWVPVNWPSNISGINVKRKTEGGAWEKLNESPITISSDDRTDLLNATNDPSELSNLYVFYDSLVANQKIPQLDEEEMRSKFLVDTESASFLKWLAFIDYRFPLVNGYAYWDFPSESKNSYNYGLFTIDKSGVESSKPIEDFDWTYGTRPELDIESTVRSSKIKRKTGIKTVWTMASSDLIAQNIKGFDIYRIDTLGRTTKLNELLTRVNMLEDSADLIMLDKEVDNSKNWKYQAIPISIFELTGKDMDTEYSGSQYMEVSMLELSLEESDLESPEVVLSWTLEAANPQSISSYRVYRKENVSEEGKEIASITDNTARKYADNTITKSGYYFYELEAISEVGEFYKSKPLMVYKQLVSKPDQPTGLSGRVIKNGQIRSIHLSWKVSEKPNDISGYRLYTDGIMSGGLAIDGSIGLLKGNAYDYPIKARYGKKHRFAISAINDEQVEGNMSDTLSIFVPSESLPIVNIWPVSKVDKRVKLEWQYPDFIDDLKGFRLYQNNVLIADEKVLGRDTRLWESDDLDPNKYQYELEAITDYNVKSKLSKPRNFNISE